MIKKITLTLCGLLLATSTNAKSFVPSKFKDYKTKYKSVMTELKTRGNELYMIKHYDIDGDMRSDVSEHYPVAKVGDKFLISQKPMVYQFDIDGDKRYSDFEVLMDEAMDGLNGNEYWVKKRVPGI